MKNDQPPLTVSELGYLWTGLSINDMSAQIMEQFHHHAADPQIKQLFRMACDVTEELLANRKELLEEAGYPEPSGFSPADRNRQAPRLFTDNYLLHYLRTGAKLGLTFHARSLVAATRADIRRHLEECLQSTARLYQAVIDVMLAKGIYWRTPSLPTPEEPEKMHKKSYLQGIFGHARPLNSIEISNLYESIELMHTIGALCIGFAQTAETRESAHLFEQGSNLAKEGSKALGNLLAEAELPLPPSLNAEITDSRQPVFSERLMLCHIAGLFGSLLTQLGYSFGSVMRHDVVVVFTEMIATVGAYSEKVTRELIEREWLDKPPGAIDRKALTT